MGRRPKIFEKGAYRESIKITFRILVIETLRSAPSVNFTIPVFTLAVLENSDSGSKAPIGVSKVCVVGNYHRKLKLKSLVFN